MNVTMTIREFYDLANAVAELSTAIGSGSVVGGRLLSYQVASVINTIQPKVKAIFDAIQFPKAKELEVAQNIFKTAKEANKLTDEFVENHHEAYKDLYTELNTFNAETDKLFATTEDFIIPSMSLSGFPEGQVMNLYIMRLSKIITNDIKG